MNLKEWFKKNKFKSKSYCNIDRLIELKKEKEETISLVIPTLNEEERVGGVVNTLKTNLVKKYPLIDEIIVMDSGSTDETKKVAEEAGAEFKLASNILKKYGNEKGKGEGMWKSLYSTNGSIVVFIDGDIENIHSRFVCGLVGPLLTHDKLKFVKSFFDRPMNNEEEGKDLGGGRVTEVLIRPLFNMYFPDLVGFIQPLSGQIAARRSLLEQLNFFTGYGIDVGLLIDAFQKYKLDSIAQVDLQTLKHRHHDLKHLSRMAFEVLQVFAERAHIMGKVIMSENVRKKYTVVNRQKNGVFLREKSIRAKAREPMITVEEYREKFKKNGKE